MKSFLIICDANQLNLLLTNAIAKPLAKQFKVYLDCPDMYAPLFVNNNGFSGAVDKPASEYDRCVDVSKISYKDAGHTVFQSFFSFFGLTWAGEGYDLQYFPRNRQKKNSLGVIIRNQWLKDYIVQNVVLKDTKIWDIPFKVNVLKQLDEINRCSHIITDDETCVHMALALRKYVEYVVTTEPSYVTEMFGSGNTHIFDYAKFSRRGQNAQINTS